MYGIFQGGHLGILHVGRKCHVSHQAVRNCVASCGHSGQTGEKQKKEKKSYRGVTEGSGGVTWS